MYYIVYTNLDPPKHLEQWDMTLFKKRNRYLYPGCEIL